MTVQPMEPPYARTGRQIARTGREIARMGASMQLERASIGQNVEARIQHAGHAATIPICSPIEMCTVRDGFERL